MAENYYENKELGIRGTADELFNAVKTGKITDPEAIDKISDFLLIEKKDKEASFCMSLLDKEEYYVYDILWDIEGDESLLEFLPSAIEIPLNIVEKAKTEGIDVIGDYISDETGFCHYSYELSENLKNEILLSNDLEMQ